MWCRHGCCGEDKKTQCLSLVSHWICGRPLGFDPDFCFSTWRRREFRQGGVITIGLTTGVLETLPLLCQIYHCVSSGLSVLRTAHTRYFPREENRRNRVTLRLPPRLHTQGRSMKVRRGVLCCGGYRVWPQGLVHEVGQLRCILTDPSCSIQRTTCSSTAKRPRGIRHELHESIQRLIWRAPIVGPRNGEDKVHLDECGRFLRSTRPERSGGSIGPAHQEGACLRISSCHLNRFFKHGRTRCAYQIRHRNIWNG